MGLFNLLFGQRRVYIQPLGAIKGDGEFAFDIVGESFHQPELERLAGKKTQDAKAVQKTAILLHEPSNPHDKKAVAVHIDGLKVGYLSRDDARSYLAQLKRSSIPILSPLSAQAMIIGGWRRKGSEGAYGVKLDMPVNEDDE